MAEWGWFAERWGWPPSTTDEQPLHFVRYAPSFYAAQDKLQNDAQERANMKERARQAASQSAGPKYGGMGV